MAGFVNRLFALPGKLGEMKIIPISKSLSLTLNSIGNWTFFVVVGIFALWVISKFIANIKTLRGEA
jgi:hypothetical protein